MDTRDILAELGARKVVGGQEDMILDVAVELAERTSAAANANAKAFAAASLQGYSH